MRARAGGLLLSMLGALLGCREAPSGPAGPPDVLLISLDTFRADLLEEEGAAETLPALQALAAEALQFTDAFAPMAFTLPSHMTLLTSLHPESHGVTTQHDRLAATTPTLAEQLRARGYETSAIVGGSWLKAGFGFDRGFDRYVELPVGLTFADRVLPFVLEQLPARAPGAPPRFVFAHFFDPHSDWSSGGNRLTYYSPPSYRQDLAVPDSYLCDGQGRCATDYLRFAERENRELSSAELALHHELYRRGVRYLDDRLAELVAELRRRGVWPRALVLLVADHGEEFREHGKLMHSQVHRESLRVPLLIRRPDDPAAASCGRLVGLEDVAPTIAALAGFPPPAPWQGRNLLEACADEAGDAVQVAQDKLVRSRYAIRNANRLLVWDFESAEGRLYDRGPGRVDGELPPGSPEVPALRDRLFRELRRLRSLRSEPEHARDSAFTSQEEEVLRSLGYL